MKNAVNTSQIRFIQSLKEVDASQWNALTGSASPFLRHEFLLALELSGCTGADSGWQPCHALLQSSDGSQLLAAMPLYLKDHSWGEYVFDWSWAEAFQSRGLSYYPKLVSAPPFTPSTGPRLLANDISLRDTYLPIFKNAILVKAVELEASSWHVLFPTPTESELWQQHGLSQRLGCQFHWFNKGYPGFAEFLATLSSRKRKNISKERENVRRQGLSFEVIEGEDIDEAYWQHFYLFYQSTYITRGRKAYLNEAFFQAIAASMPESLLLVMAKQGLRYVAGALFFKSDKNIYGRYWGSLADFRFLHFETCFYQGIDYCIRRGLHCFDAGAQGEHKIQRGFEPVFTYSNHWIANDMFAAAISDFLRREREHIESYKLEAEKLLPFRHSSGR